MYSLSKKLTTVLLASVVGISELGSSNVIDNPVISVIARLALRKRAISPHGDVTGTTDSTGCASGSTSLVEKAKALIPTRMRGEYSPPVGEAGRRDRGGLLYRMMMLTVVIALLAIASVTNISNFLAHLLFLLIKIDISCDF